MKMGYCRSFSTQDDNLLDSKKRVLLPTGVSNFASIRSLNYTIVDKTLLIKQVFEIVRGSPLLITRPRRWGKTVNLSMIQAYFDILAANTFEDTFKGTEIYKDKDFETEYANKYPVISIDFNNFLLESTTQMPWPESEFQRVLTKIIEQYSVAIRNSKLLSSSEIDAFFYLQTTSNKGKILFGLGTIMKILKKHYQRRCIVLIDEYDTPYNIIALKPNSKIKMEHFKDAYKSFLIDAFKNSGDDALQLGIMTGVLRISHDQLLCGLNNLTCDMVYKQRILDSKFFGFTEAEVKDVIAKTTLFSSPKSNKTIEEVRGYYNGYRRLEDEESFYNPWSIAQFCIRRQLLSYWKASATDAWLKLSYQILPLFEKAELDFVIHEDLEVLKPLEDKIHIEHIDTDHSMFWSLLIHTGYLTFSEKQPSPDFGNLYSLKLPNKDAFEALENVVSRFENLLSKDFMRTVKRSIQDDDLDKLFITLNEWISKGQDTGYTYASESSYHMFLYQTFRICLYKENWEIYSERISNNKGNRFDIAVASKDRLYLFELKFLAKKSEENRLTKIGEALKQIDAKEYFQYFNYFKDDASKKKTKIGVVGQDKTLYYEIDVII